MDIYIVSNLLTFPNQLQWDLVHISRVQVHLQEKIPKVYFHAAFVRTPSSLCVHTNIFGSCPLLFLKGTFADRGLNFTFSNLTTLPPQWPFHQSLSPALLASGSGKPGHLPPPSWVGSVPLSSTKVTAPFTFYSTALGVSGSWGLKELPLLISTAWPLAKRCHLLFPACPIQGPNYDSLLLIRESCSKIHSFLALDFPCYCL